MPLDRRDCRYLLALQKLTLMIRRRNRLNQHIMLLIRDTVRHLFLTITNTHIAFKRAKIESDVRARPTLFLDCAIACLLVVLFGFVMNPFRLLTFSILL